MTVQFSTALRTARVQAIEDTIGTAPVVKLRTGSPPANCGTADSGTVVATFTLASNWATTSAGVLTFSNTPIQDLTADNAGGIAHYRVYASDGTTCHMQGTVTLTGGGGDMTVDNDDVEAGQEINITGWTITDGNA